MTDVASPRKDSKEIKLSLIAQYIRDVSFENIAALKGGSPDDSLQLDVKLDVEGARGNEDRVSVGMRVKAEAKAKDNSMFIIDIEYVGIFQCQPSSAAVTNHYLLTKGPEMLFPYVRAIITYLTINGGFPPVMLDPIDFEKLYQKRLAKQKKKKSRDSSSSSDKDGSSD